MFGFLKGKEMKIFSVCDGKTISIEKLEDDVFASKVLGDGIGIRPYSNIISSPIDGEVALIFNTKHAFIIKGNDGIEVLIHIGFDTVKLNGQGFKQLIDQGKKVKIGTPIIEIDSRYIKDKGFLTDIAVVITNMDMVKSIQISSDNKEIERGTEVITYIKK